MRWRERKLVFVCSPYAGDVEANVANARRIAKLVIEAGRTPCVPHLLLPQVLDDGDEEQRLVGLECGLSVLLRCDEVWAWAPDKRASRGMQLELERARKEQIPVYWLEGLESNARWPLEDVQPPIEGGEHAAQA